MREICEKAAIKIDEPFFCVAQLFRAEFGSTLPLDRFCETAGIAKVPASDTSETQL